MSDPAEHHAGRLRGVRFDPTINLGHILTAGAFLCSTAAAWVSLDARVSQQAKDGARIERSIEPAISKVETTLMTRINDERARLDQTQVRTADDVREIKQIMRDGFRDLDSKLERKADKPGR